MTLGDVLADPGRIDPEHLLCVPERSWPWDLDTPGAALTDE